MPSKPAYPGRTELDTANQRFRRGVARLYREATRHDVKLLPEVERIVLQAAAVLDRLGAEAEKAEELSQRHQDAMKREEDKMRAAVKKMARNGDNPRAAAMLVQVEEMAERRRGQYAEFQARATD